MGSCFQVKENQRKLIHPKVRMTNRREGTNFQKELIIQIKRMPKAVFLGTYRNVMKRKCSQMHKS
jgi:hypothetical protein